VSITGPVSADPKVYRGFTMAGSLNVPLPDVAHKTVPFNAEASLSATLAVPAHRALSAPAPAEGTPAKVRTILSVRTTGQPFILVPVSVKVTFVRSVGPREYTGLRSAGLLNVPDPEVVQR